MYMDGCISIRGGREILFFSFIYTKRVKRRRKMGKEGEEGGKEKEGKLFSKLENGSVVHHNHESYQRPFV